MRVDALEARGDDDRAFGEIVAHALLVDAEDARLAVRIVGQDAYLCARVALRLQSQVLQGDGEEADRHLLAGGCDDVDFARSRVRGKLTRKCQQPIRLARHRGNDDNELMTVAMEARDALRDIADAIDRADRRATV